MKKFLVAIVFGLMAIAAQAEATFDQIQVLIEQHNYQAAEQGLEVIIKNHPQSAKAFYAMAQAQAGLGNLEKAKKALDIATGLNPTLDFAPASSVASLKQAITPQVKKIEAIEETHTVRNTILVIFVLALGVVVYMVYRRNEEAEEAHEAKRKQAEADEQATRDAIRKREHMEMLANQEAARKADEAAEAAIKAHKNYGHERFDPENPDKLKTVKRMKEEAAEKQRLFLEAEARRERLRAEAAEDEARRARMTYSAPTHTTVVNNSNDGLVTGMILGSMMSNSHHDHTTIIEHDVVRDTPSRSSRSSTWDDTDSDKSSSTGSSKSSTWDDDSSSKKSSSWDDSSSSSSSSSWSSSSDSSSSWDSGSSSSSSSDW